MNFSGSLLNYGSLTNDQGVQAGSVAHRRAWEAGHVDYQGRDSFNNIQEQLEKNIAQQQQQYHPSQPRQTTPPKFVLHFFLIKFNSFFLDHQMVTIKHKQKLLVSSKQQQQIENRTNLLNGWTINMFS